MARAPGRRFYHRHLHAPVSLPVAATSPCPRLARPCAIVAHWEERMIEDTRVIDVHHHFLPRPVFDALKAEAGGGVRLVNDRISITLRDDLYSVEAHLQAMDEGQVETAVLTYSGVSLLG